MSARLVRLAVLLVLLAGAGGAVAQQLTDRPFVPLSEANCWGCHATWTPPLRDMVRIVPPASMGAAIDEPFEYTVRFQQAWTPRPSVPELQFVNPTLDLSGAPSLRFVGEYEDIVGNTTRGRIVINPATPLVPQSNTTRIAIPPGPTAISWTLRPDDTGPSAPDLTLLVQPPGGNGTRIINDRGRGEPESLNYTLEDLQAMVAGGNWTVGARVRPIEAVTNLTAPQATSVDFTIEYSVEFDTAALKLLGYPQDRVVKGGSSYLQTWRLRFVQEPAAGETIRITFASTPFFDHGTQPPSADRDNVVDEPLEVEVRGGATPAIVSPQSGITGRTPPINGPTATRVSEAVGYASAFLLIASIVSGGMFGQASRRGLNRIFHSAKRRVAYHNFLSYGLTVAALVHMVIFMVPLVPGGPCAGIPGEWCITTGSDSGIHRMTEDFQGSMGLLWFGGPAMAAMFGLGVTGALQVPMIRRWSYPTWKWWHYGLTVATIAFTAMHMLVDGQNFGTVVDPQFQRDFGDPLFEDPLAATATA